MAYQWKTRDKTTPGGYYWTDVAVALLFAEQQAADAAILTAATLDVDGTDTTVAFGASNGTAKTAAVWTAAQAAQLAADRAAGASVFGGHVSRRV